MTIAETKVLEYVKFKFEQFLRVTGFDYNQENAESKMRSIFASNYKEWTIEASKVIA